MSFEATSRSPERSTEPTHLEVLAAERVGVSGPGKIPLERLADLNGLKLLITRLEVENGERADLSPKRTIVVSPGAIAYAYSTEGIKDHAAWWSGYAAATTRFEGGTVMPGELRFDETAGRLITDPNLSPEK